jgi:hypothetical protein
MILSSAVKQLKPTWHQSCRVTQPDSDGDKHNLEEKQTDRYALESVAKFALFPAHLLLSP